MTVESERPINASYAISTHILTKWLTVQQVFNEEEIFTFWHICDVMKHRKGEELAGLESVRSDYVGVLKVSE